MCLADFLKQLSDISTTMSHDPIPEVGAAVAADALVALLDGP